MRHRSPGWLTRPAPSWSRARRRVSTAKNAGSSSSSGWRGRGRSIDSMPTIRPGPRRQHDDAVGDEHRLGDRVGDEQHGGRQRLAQPGQQVAHVGAGDLVEGGERLVHQQQRRAERHRPHEGDALLHAARQLVRVGVGEVGEADLGEQLGGVRAARRSPRWRLTSSSRRALAATVRHGSRRRRLRDEADALGRRGPRAGWRRRRVTRPPVGSSRPPTMRSSVVLPLPLGPRTVTISPASTARSIGASASTAPNDLVTPDQLDRDRRRHGGRAYRRRDRRRLRRRCRAVRGRSLAGSVAAARAASA